MLRDAGANISFAPADFRRFTPLLPALAPRVMTTAASPPDGGRLLLALAARRRTPSTSCIGPAPTPSGCCSPRPRRASPGRAGCRPTTCTACTSTRSTGSSRATPRRCRCPRPSRPRPSAGSPPTRPPSSATAATLQTGIGAVPSMIATILAEGDGGDYGVHSEMFTSGLMELHEAGKVSEPQGQSRRRLGRHLRRRQRGALRLAGRQRRGRLPAGRRRQLAGLDPRQSADGDDQRRDRGRRPGPGRRRHGRRPPVLGHRRPRGLRHRAGARARATGPCSACLDGDDRRRAALADRALLRGGRGGHDPAPPGRRDRHRVRGRRAAGQDDPPARHSSWRASPTPTSATSCVEAAERASGGNSPLP